MFPAIISCLISALGDDFLEAPFLLRDHGPGTSGGGASTQSGETMKPGTFAVDIREDYTEFQKLSVVDIVSKATRSSPFDFDTLDRSFLTTVSFAWGVVEDFQVGVSIGYYTAVKARSATFDPVTNMTTIATFDPNGQTDMWLTGKYRFFRGWGGHFAVFGGVKFPTGAKDMTTSAGDRVEPSASAGSGSFDGMIGVAHSRWLTERIALDASAQYTIRGEYRNFKIGDRFDLGVAGSYRLTEDIKEFPQAGAFLEWNLRILQKTVDTGVTNPNTGGVVLFISPGVRLGATPHVSFTLSAQVPVLQDLNGQALETLFKIIFDVTISL